MKHLKFPISIIFIFAITQNCIARENITLNRIYNILLNVSSSSNIYDFKDEVELLNFYSNELQGTYKDKQGNSISISKTGIDDQITIFYYSIKGTADDKALEKELIDETFYIGNSKDGTLKVYNSPNDRFSIRVSKYPSYTSYVVYENEKVESYKTKVYARPWIADKDKLTITSYTNYTSAYIQKGSTVCIHATGRVKIGDFTGYVGPKGTNHITTWNVTSSANYGALLVKIGEKQWMPCNTDTLITATEAGYLQFMINDRDPKDNDDYFRVEYGINRLLPKYVRYRDSLKALTPPAPKITAGHEGIKLLINDRFENNNNNWKSTSGGQYMSINGSQLEYINFTSDNYLPYSLSQPLELDKMDNYAIEMIAQSETSWSDTELKTGKGFISRKPGPLYYGFMFGDEKNNIILATGATPEARPGYGDCPCKPGQFYAQTIDGYLKVLEWTLSPTVMGTGQTNKLILTKKDKTLSFLVNGQMIKQIPMPIIGEPSRLYLFSSTQSKMIVKSLKVIRFNP